MTSRQNRMLQVLSSIAVGIMAFCITLPVVLILGAIALTPFLSIESDAFFPPEFIILFLISILVGLVVAVFVGIKYYRHMENRLSQ